MSTVCLTNYRAIYAVLALLLGSLVGCAPVVSQSADLQGSILPAAVPSPDSVTLEIIFARLPQADAETAQQVWSVIDEQQLPADVRRALAGNGFRVGVIGGQMPSVLARAMNMQAEPTDDPHESGVTLAEEPRVRRRLLQLASGSPGEILASRVYDELPLLRNDNGQISGSTFHTAQGLFAIRATVRPDGQAEISLLPEIHHGEPSKQWSGGDEGIFRLEMSKPRERFDDLRIATVLRPGEALVATCRVDRPGSLGHHFFCDESSRGPEQKVLLIRLSQTPARDLFATNAQAAETKPRDTARQ